MLYREVNNIIEHFSISFIGRTDVPYIPFLRFRQFGLALDVPISYVNVGCDKWDLPMIKPSDLYQHLADLGKLDLLFGKQPPSVLLEFWNRFQAVEPLNPIHAAFAAGKMDAAKTIPVYIHGDEGRGKKRTPVMVVNTHGVIGAGCRSFEEYHKDAPTIRKTVMPVNIKGNSAETRFLSFVLAKKAYGPGGEEYLLKLFDALVSDLELLQRQGVKANGETFHIAAIGAVGDLQYFAKVGGLTRSYNHVSKKTNQKTKAGICHLCLAGLPGWPFEHFDDAPSWIQSVGSEDPWQTPPSMVTRPCASPDNPASFFKPDLWHCLHLGAAKIFLSSALVEWLPELPGDVAFTSFRGSHSLI